MKNYLNQEERDSFVKTVVMTGYLEDVTKMDLDKMEELKYFKVALTSLTKATKHLLSRLDASFAAKVQRDIDTKELLMVSNSRAKLDLEENEQRHDALDLIYETVLLLHCKNCQKENQKDCEVRAAFATLHVPELHETGRGCHYDYNRKA